jgi:membrane-bound ClpP family serine protease
MTLWLFTLLALSAILLGAELLLPSHGILGIAALLCYGGAVGMCFAVHRGLGLGVLIGSLLAAPFVGMGLLGIWQRSPIGRRLTLSAVAGTPDAVGVMVGQHGVAVSELRPGGEAEFGEHRIQARSDSGPIRPGTPVRVIAFADNVATVRAI